MTNLKNFKSDLKFFKYQLKNQIKNDQYYK